MKNRTDTILLVVFLVSTLAYLLLLVLFLHFGGTIPVSPIAYLVSQSHLWLVLGGHAVPFFALQLLLCRRSEGGSKFLAIQLAVVMVFLAGFFALAARSTPGWDALIWIILAMGSIAPAAGCVLAWAAYGFAYFYQRKKHRSPTHSP